MMDEYATGRLEQVRALLARAGVAARLSTAGADDEILAVHAPPAARSMLARLAPEVRSLGFRYVTIELDAGDP